MSWSPISHGRSSESHASRAKHQKRNEQFHHEDEQTRRLQEPYRQLVHIPGHRSRNWLCLEMNRQCRETVPCRISAEKFHRAGQEHQPEQEPPEEPYDKPRVAEEQG